MLDSVPFLVRHNAKEGRFGREDDVNIVFNNRVANLKKIYPYIPESLNRILPHFSKGAKKFYDHTSQLLDDLSEVRKELCSAKTF